MSTYQHNNLVHSERRLHQLEKENRKLCERLDSLRSELDSLRQKVNDLESTNHDLETVNQELTATLQAYALSASSRKPSFSINYSSERNPVNLSSSAKSPHRSKPKSPPVVVPVVKRIRKNRNRLFY